MKDGVYTDLSFDDYLGMDDRVSRSGLMGIIPPWTPADYWWAHTHPTEEKDPMRFGTVIHTSILEPHAFTDRHTCFSLKPNRVLVDVDKARAKGCLTKTETKAEEVAALADGKTIVDKVKYDMACTYGAMVRGHPACARLLAEGKPEVTVLYTDKDTGVEAKTRQDWGLSPNGLVVDVKSTASLSERFLSKHIAELGYGMQAVMIRDACRANGIPWTGHVIIWCRTDEKHRPLVEAQRLTPLWFRHGEVQLRQAFSLLAECRETGLWPGPATLIGETYEPLWLERWIETQETIEQSDQDYPEL